MKEFITKNTLIIYLSVSALIHHKKYKVKSSYYLKSDFKFIIIYNPQWAVQLSANTFFGNYSTELRQISKNSILTLAHVFLAGSLSDGNIGGGLWRERWDDEAVWRLVGRDAML